jgi:sulfoxide reductase heme-binding subunit YedZ
MCAVPVNRRRVAQVVVVALGSIPLLWLAADAFGDRLGANPIEEITHRTGDWTIRFLLATLAVSPLRRFTGWNWLIKFRRTIGLIAFSYASVHFLTYIGLDQGFALSYVGDDIAKRPYITVGFIAFTLLIPLAVTSTQGWVRRLGGKRWNALHRLIYIAAALGVLHYLWLVKGDQLTPVYYAAILVALLVLRIRRHSPPAPTRPLKQRIDLLADAPRGTQVGGESLHRPDARVQP